MDAATQHRIDRWLADPAIAEADKAEIRSLQTAGDADELTDRFHRELEFGTGGLRGIMGPGTNRMNLYTVGAAAQGLANYIHKTAGVSDPAFNLQMTAGPANDDHPSVAIAFDSRINSERFARRVACVLAANGISAHLFESLRPTPQLSFAVRRLRCIAGVMITASHNPPAYNGLKVFWSGGGQVTPPHDLAILDEVRNVRGFSDVRAMDFEVARSKSLILLIDRAIDELYHAAVEEACLDPRLCRRQGGSLKIIFTPLHGAGAASVPEALRRRGFERVLVVPEQANPDGNFPTLKSPNPEEPAAFDLAIAFARSHGADLVIATDPDADRMGIAVRTSRGDYKLLTGNQAAALMTYYLCEQLTRQQRFPPRTVVISTIVSGDLMKDIARSYGAEVIETLTGFKWIAAKVSEIDSDAPEHRRHFLFAAEESYGCMPYAFVRDKDAVAAAALIAEAAAFAAEQGKTLCDLLDDLYRRFGYYAEGALNITMPGAEGAARIKSLMENLRQNPPATLAGLPVATLGDVMSGEIRDLRNGEIAGRYSLPKSDVVVFTLSDGSKVIARPSGTEPKIKFYIRIRTPPGDLSAMKQAAQVKISQITSEMREVTGVS